MTKEEKKEKRKEMLKEYKRVFKLKAKHIEDWYDNLLGYEGLLDNYEDVLTKGEKKKFDRKVRSYKWRINNLLDKDAARFPIERRVEREAFFEQDAKERKLVMDEVGKFFEEKNIDMPKNFVTSTHRSPQHNIWYSKKRGWQTGKKKPTGHAKFGAVDFNLQLKPFKDNKDLQEDFIEHMRTSESGFRVLDEREAKSGKASKVAQGIGRGVVHVDSMIREKYPQRGVWDKKGTFREELPDAQSKGAIRPGGDPRQVLGHRLKPKFLNLTKQRNEMGREEFADYTKRIREKIKEGYFFDDAQVEVDKEIIAEKEADKTEVETKKPVGVGSTHPLEGSNVPESMPAPKQMPTPAPKPMSQEEQLKKWKEELEKINSQLRDQGVKDFKEGGEVAKDHPHKKYLDELDEFMAYHFPKGKAVETDAAKKADKAIRSKKGSIEPVKMTGGGSASWIHKRQQEIDALEDRPMREAAQQELNKQIQEFNLSNQQAKVHEKNQRGFELTEQINKAQKAKDNPVNRPVPQKEIVDEKTKVVEDKKTEVVDEKEKVPMTWRGSKEVFMIPPEEKERYVLSQRRADLQQKIWEAEDAKKNPKKPEPPKPGVLNRTEQAKKDLEEEKPTPEWEGVESRKLASEIQTNFQDIDPETGELTVEAKEFIDQVPREQLDWYRKNFVPKRLPGYKELVGEDKLIQDSIIRRKDKAKKQLDDSITESIKIKEVVKAPLTQAEKDYNLKQADIEKLENYKAQAQKEHDDVVQSMLPIDPSRFWKQRSTWQKILAAISIGMGAYAGAATGGVNRAVSVINAAINQDIEAQKGDNAHKAQLKEAAWRKVESYAKQIGADKKLLGKLAVGRNAVHQKNRKFVLLQTLKRMEQRGIPSSNPAYLRIQQEYLSLLDKNENARLAAARGEWNKKLRDSKADIVVGEVEKLNSVLQGTGGVSAAGALYSIIRAIDPGSVVRETETKLILNFGGPIGNRLQRKYNEWFSEGGTLTDKDRQDMYDLVLRLARGKLKNVSQMYNRERKNAIAMGLSPNLVVGPRAVYDQLSGLGQQKIVDKIKRANPNAERKNIIKSLNRKLETDPKFRARMGRHGIYIFGAPKQLM